jgi:hypothetical protein
MQGLCHHSKSFIKYVCRNQLYSEKQNAKYSEITKEKFKSEILDEELQEKKMKVNGFYDGLNQKEIERTKV